MGQGQLHHPAGGDVGGVHRALPQLVAAQHLVLGIHAHQVDHLVPGTRLEVGQQVVPGGPAGGQNGRGTSEDTD